MVVFELLKLLCPKDQIIGSALVFWSSQDSLNLWLTNIGKQKPTSSVSCWNKLWSTVEASVFLQDQPELETVPILPLLWFLPYSCSTPFTHLPVIPENISLINHLQANPHPQMGLRKTQSETRHFPNSSRCVCGGEGIRFLLEDTRHSHGEEHSREWRWVFTKATSFPSLLSHLQSISLRNPSSPFHCLALSCITFSSSFTFLINSSPYFIILLVNTFCVLPEDSEKDYLLGREKTWILYHIFCFLSK